MNEDPHSASAIAPPPSEPLPTPPRATARPLLRNKFEEIIVAFSLAHLCLIGAWFPLLFDADKGYYNKVRVAAPSLLALLVNGVGLGLIFWAILRRSRPLRSAGGQLVCALVLGFVLLVPLDFCRVSFWHMSAFRLVLALKNPFVLLALTGALIFILWRPRFAARIPFLLTLMLAPLALFNYTKTLLLLLGIVQVAQHSTEPKLAPLLPVRDGAPRLIWILFDEMDQRLLFERRPAGWNYPEFDRLRDESLAATNAYPPANYTFLSIPGLISGRLVTGAQIANSSDLRLSLAKVEEERLWSELPSVFKDARTLGLNSAVVGWFHPYGRILSSQVSYCSWYAHPMYEPARAPTFFRSLFRELTCAEGAFHRKRLYIELCRAALKDALSLGTNTQYGLMMLHLPPPHTPGVYLPSQDRFSVWGIPKADGYFNNLALADRWLGSLRREMESQGLWQKTWVIVSTDHCWRESFAYDGRLDMRIPFLLKAPGHSQSMQYTPRINTVVTRDLITAVLTGDIKDLPNAKTWLDTHAHPDPPVSGSDDAGE